MNSPSIHKHPYSKLVITALNKLGLLFHQYKPVFLLETRVHTLSPCRFNMHT